MINKNYGHYSYFSEYDNEKEGVDYQYNDNIFNEYIQNKNYNEAANYLKSFYFNDTKEQNDHLNRIAILERIGNIRSAIQSKFADNKDMLNALEVAENIDSNPGINNLRKSKENDLAQNLINNFDDIGRNRTTNFLFNVSLPDAYAPGERFINEKASNLFENNATSLRLTFKPKKQTLFNIDWLDWAVKDNENNLENYLNNVGLSKEELKAKNVKIEKDKEGNDVITFDKSNPLALSLLYNLPNSQNNSIGADIAEDVKMITLLAGTLPHSLLARSEERIEGLVDDDISYKRDLGFFADKINAALTGKQLVHVDGLDDKGKLLKYSNIRVGGWHIEKNSITNLQEYVNSAINAKTKAYNPDINDEEMLEVCPSTIGGPIFDEDSKLQTLLSQGKITSENYKAARKDLLALRFQELNNLSSNQEIYINSKEGINALYPVTDGGDFTRDDVYNLISSTPNENIHLLAGTAGGKYGAWVQIDALPEDNKNISRSTSIKDRVKQSRYMIFLPGLWSDEVQAKINQDTNLKSSQTVNDILQYNNIYTMENGAIISKTKNNKFQIDYKGGAQDIINDTEELTRLINNDLAFRQLNRQRIFNHFNYKNEFVDQNEYLKEIAYDAIVAANDGYNKPLTYLDGTPIPYEDLIDFFTDKSKIDLNNVNFATYMRISRANDNYKQGINNAKKYFK